MYDTLLFPLCVPILLLFYLKLLIESTIRIVLVLFGQQRLLIRLSPTPHNLVEVIIDLPLQYQLVGQALSRCHSQY